MQNEQNRSEHKTTQKTAFTPNAIDWNAMYIS